MALSSCSYMSNWSLWTTPFDHTIPRSAQYYCYGKSSVCVCMSFFDVECRDHVAHNSSEIILWPVSLGCLLSSDPNIMDLLQEKFGPEYGWGMHNSGFRHTTAVICVKRTKVAPRLLSLLLRTIRKSPITASTFHSRLKTHLFHKSSPP